MDNLNSVSLSTGLEVKKGLISVLYFLTNLPGMEAPDMNSSAFQLREVNMGQGLVISY